MNATSSGGFCAGGSGTCAGGGGNGTGGGDGGCKLFGLLKNKSSCLIGECRRLIVAAGTVAAVAGVTVGGSS